MISLLLIIVSSVWFSFVIHEYSHYWMGRFLGIPKNKIRVVLNEPPPHVALYHNGYWLSPGTAEYISAFTVFRAEPWAGWLYIAAGMLGETGVILVLSTLLTVFNFHVVGVTLLATSSIILAIYFLVDVLLTNRFSKPYGDFMSMWSMSKGMTILFIILLLLFRSYGFYFQMHQFS